ncbi:terpenoid cyclases/Protein prenyltransferase [Hymenopellis radicata]|nr:terpenoid cyclases/Protein prenyltransferase [Hymenopellis radicata]
MTKTPVDGFPTSTSATQHETEDILIKHLPPPSASAANHYVLQKTKHLQYLMRTFTQGFPQRYTSQDASQPWLMFWTLQSFSLLKVGLDPGNRQRAIDTILTWQHPQGGFGGGPGQAAHLLTTYAAVCALAIVGRPGKGGGWDDIDRTKLYSFFMSLKQRDGSYLVAHHAEVDVRGIYCLLVVATLLDLMTPELVRGTREFVRSCQTYEGGFSSASQPYYDADGNLMAVRPPLGEAHGGYTFCALASWVLLEPCAEEGEKEIDKSNLLRWLVQMQGGKTELGGFKGRTNKLVDGCYSWWVGGAFALFESLHPSSKPHLPNPHPPEGDVDEDAWDDIEEGLLNREALQEYILLAGQHPAGGLRDKPPKPADAYHTEYVLAGLSTAQHRVAPDEKRKTQLEAAWNDRENEDEALRKRVYLDAMCWQQDETGSSFIGGIRSNEVNASHPLFNLTITHTQAVMGHFYGQNVPRRDGGA